MQTGEDSSSLEDNLIALFYDKDRKAYDAEAVRETLRDVGADDCETLFIHSDVAFGSVPADFNRKEYLQILSDVVFDLGAKYVIVPTFTYSFCNNEDYDVRKSKTSMGAFNEYVRKLPERYRTLDPLLSMSVPEKLMGQFSHLCNHSLGVGSGMDVLHGMDGVKFLFFGARQGECFTYLHYVEKMLNVPYRYDQPFKGVVVDYDGNRHEKEQTIHTHCYGVKIPQSYDYFEAELINKGLVRKYRLGDSYVSCLNEKDAYREICEKIKSDPCYFVEGTYKDEDLVHKYGFGQNGERVTHC